MGTNLFTQKVAKSTFELWVAVGVIELAQGFGAEAIISEKDFLAHATWEGLDDKGWEP